jgi:probable F420-dependent oxidoreductase
VSKPALAIIVSAAAHAGQDLRLVLDVARAIDAAGIDGIRVAEHSAMSADTSRYVWSAYPLAPNAPWFEPMTQIAAMAAVTERVIFHTGVLIAALRPAVVLAKQAATLDILSGGRFILGVGTGWQPEELEAGGVPYAERGSRMTETIAACRALWRDSPASFDGRHIKFTDLYCEPRPASRGGVPVWFAGPLNERQLARIVELGDGWMPIMGSSPDSIATDRERLRGAFASAGRDPDSIAVSDFAQVVRDADGRAQLAETLEASRARAEHGVTMVALSLAGFSSDLAEYPRLVGAVARRWERL